MLEKKVMSGKIVLISFLCTALIEIFNVVLYYIFPEEIPYSIFIPLTALEYSFILIALIFSMKGLFYNDNKSKKLNFIYAIASIIWLSEKIVETLNW